MPKLNRYGKDGGHFGFMQIRKNAQGCQAGTRRILAQEHLGTSNPSKNKSYTTIPGSAQKPPLAARLIGIIRTEKCWPNSPTYSTDVGVLRGWGRAQITVDILGREAKKVEKHCSSNTDSKEDL